MLKRMMFCIFFVPFFATAQTLDRVIAVVNDGVITASELNKQVDVMRQQLHAQKVQIPSEAALRKQVLQHLINVDLELQLAKQHGITIDDTELNDAIAKIASNNKLSLTQLRSELEKQGLVWKAYRENIRKEILISRLQQKAVAKDIVVTPKQVENYLKTAVNLEQNKRTYHLQNILIPLPEAPTSEQLLAAEKKAQELLAKIKAGDDFTKLAIEQSSDQFALEGGDLGERHLAELPELFANEVTTMKAGQIKGPLRTGNGVQLIKLIAINGSDESHQVNKTHVRHILLKQDASMTVAEAKKQASNLYQQLHSGKDFALMAKQYSLDVSSAIKGGDLGWVSPGQLVVPFEKSMDKLAINEISKPVKTVYGWHLIQVLERKSVDDSKAFKRQQVRLYLQQRKFTEAVQNWQQHLRGEAYVQIMDKDLA